MDWNEAIALLHGADWKHAKIGLDRMKALMSALGNPQKKLRFIHIAGTNGKGSTCSMVRSILTEAGFKTGLYISPHLFSFNERISVDGTDISDDDLRRISGKVKAAVKDLNEEPTDFELITAMALCYFYEEGCDYVVLEVGMGGRLDATNIIDAPEVAAIMSIGLDHTEVLGDTEELIAAEKAGIIKSGAPLVVLNQKGSVLQVIADKYIEVNGANAEVSALIPFRKDSEYSLEKPLLHCDLTDKTEKMVKSYPDQIVNRFSGRGYLTVTDPEKLIVHSYSLKGEVFSYRSIKNIELPLLGSYQIDNAMTAIDIILSLKSRGADIDDEAIKQGLLNSRWPGRFELLSGDPVFILDGAHNPNGAEALAESIKVFLPDQKIIFVMGVMKDKDHLEMLKIITPFADSFIAELPYDGRGLEPEELKKEIFTVFEGPVFTAPSIKDAIAMAVTRGKELNLPIVCFGSLYQAGEVRRYFLH
ncbi:bifunctional folylpolyglutamate synthase/dihydrofolate synthase [Oribacterium sp. FC2011]|uniref:bifunctional folylpolyglutamate synthase/dihydrofolate synthase n=1 Tax=Oribacterium sp. FC2011 TaxID=1408311 RepID=UPI0005D26FB1|nr:folylpolyglutamate synthase/dihydrofolate synthase family protein [Oribacterium sp. FC2011]